MDKLFCKSTDYDIGRSTASREDNLNLEYTSVPVRIRHSPAHDGRSPHVTRWLAGLSTLGRMPY